MKAAIETLEGVTYNKPLMQKLATLFNYNIESEQLENKTTKDMQTTEDIETTEDMDNTNHMQDQQEKKEQPIDDRTFFQKYTPINILREIVWRLQRRP